MQHPRGSPVSLLLQLQLLLSRLFRFRLQLQALFKHRLPLLLVLQPQVC